MRNPCRFIALGVVALAATPALAQINVGAGGQVGVGVGVDTRPVVDTVGRTLDRTVDAADRTVNRTLTGDLRVAARSDVRAGASVRDHRGRRIGTVQSVHGDTALVVQGNRRMHVPLASLYRSRSGLVTSLSRAQVRASADADVRAGARN